MSVVGTASWPLVDRLLWQAREAAFATGEFVGQESFISAAEILWLADRAGVRHEVSVLDLCCGAGGPGLFVARSLGCTYLGVDADPDAIVRARQRAAAAGVAARFELARLPPLPTGKFDVVLLLETLLAFRDKRRLLSEVAGALPVGGRFAFTLEAGQPLSSLEQDAMPAANTVWLTTRPDLQADLASVGLQVRWLEDWSAAHRNTVGGLATAYAAAEPEVRAAGGGDAVNRLITSHRLWSQWLDEGRVRKYAAVAEKVAQ